VSESIQCGHMLDICFEYAGNVGMTVRVLEETLVCDCSGIIFQWAFLGALGKFFPSPEAVGTLWRHLVNMATVLEMALISLKPDSQSVLLQFNLGSYTVKLH
jgi:hypothetical protein